MGAYTEKVDVIDAEFAGYVPMAPAGKLSPRSRTSVVWDRQADIAYTSYQLDGTDRTTRPVTFFFNGGPGSSSAWLQLGNAGPWRLPINADEVTPSTSLEAKPNAETWLDFTDVENYAQGELLADLLKGEADSEASNRVADKIAALAGIDQGLTRGRAGRIDIDEFRRELGSGKVTGGYDASVRGLDPYPHSAAHRFGDPPGNALAPPMTSAAVDVLARKLKWRPDGSYKLFNGAVGKAWDFGNKRPESLSELRQALAADAKMEVLLGHGPFDLVTPYFATKMALAQLPALASAPRVTLLVLPGGHMFYSRDASRQDFRAEVEAMITSAAN